MEDGFIIDKRTWDEFRETGLLWFINSILYAFGWAICVDIGEDGLVSSASPARVKFRGFEGEINDQGYKKVARYLQQNAESICDDVMNG